MWQYAKVCEHEQSLQFDCEWYEGGSLELL